MDDGIYAVMGVQAAKAASTCCVGVATSFHIETRCQAGYERVIRDFIGLDPAAM